MPKGRLIVICTGWQCEEYKDRCLESIFDQGKDLDKGSIMMINYCVDGNEKSDESSLIDMSIGGERIGKLANFIKMINNIHPDLEDIICDVDLDDYLLPGALKTVLGTYEQNPGTLLTYGSYCMESGKHARYNGEYKNNNFRGSKWLASHLKTFKYKLYREIKVRDINGHDGKPFMSAGDVALMMPMLEMAGLDRIKHIKKCLYCYNDLNPLNDHKVHSDEQKRNERYIRKVLPQRPRMNEL